MSIVNVVGFHSKKMKKIDQDVDARTDVKCFQKLLLHCRFVRPHLLERGSSFLTL